MQSDDLTKVREARLYATRAAAHIGLLSREAGLSVDEVTWESLSELPQWCLASDSERRELQRNCGAMFLAPLIQASVDGAVLRKVSGFLGDEVFHHVRSMECSYTLPGGLESEKLEVEFMASGSSVLLGTLDCPVMAQLFTRSLGPSGHDLDADTARELYLHAKQLNESLQESRNESLNVDGYERESA